MFVVIVFLHFQPKIGFSRKLAGIPIPGIAAAESRVSSEKKLNGNLK
jgi:hypothetical protein